MLLAALDYLICSLEHKHTCHCIRQFLSENLERMGLLGGLAQNQARGGIEERLANLRERQQEGFEGQNHIGNIFNLLNLLGGLQNEQGRQQQGNAQETYAADVGRQRNYNPPQAQENVGRAGTNPVF